MPEVDLALRELGSEIRAIVAEQVDVEADLGATLRRGHTTDIAAVQLRAPGPSRFALGAVAAALIVTLVGVLVIVGRDDSEVVPNDTIAPPDSAIVPVTTVVPQTTNPPSTTPTVPPSTNPLNAPAATANSLPPQPVLLPVSYLDPPATFEPTPFASIAVDPTVGTGAEFAVGDGIVVIWGGGTTITTVDVATGSTTNRELVVPVSQPVIGPGNVLYGLAFEPPSEPPSQMPTASIVAQSLGSDPSGVLGAVPVDTNTYLELPRGAFAAGPDGVYDLDRTQSKVMDFVDVGATWPSVPLATHREPDPTVRMMDGSAAWTLAVTQDPNAASPFLGDSPPFPGPDGSIRVARFIGPRLETEPVDFGTPTQPVVADLRPGAGRWWSLPDRWSVVAGSVHGTLLARTVGPRTELAWFDPEPPPAFAFVPTTVLAVDDGFIVAIDRDERGNETRGPAPDQAGWPNGCTQDDLKALFATVPTGSTLERLACDRSASTIAAGDFLTAGVRSTVRIIDDGSGWTSDFDDTVGIRFANMRTTPIVPAGAVPIGQSTPISVRIADRPTPVAPALFEIAASITNAAEFGAEVERLLQDLVPNSATTSAVVALDGTDLVVATQRPAGEALDETIHYYWLSRRGGLAQSFVDRAIETSVCTNYAAGAECF